MRTTTLFICVASIVFILMVFAPRPADADLKKLIALKKIAALALLGGRKKFIIPLPLPIPLPIPIITSKQQVIQKESHYQYQHHGGGGHHYGGGHHGGGY